jgi:hypothetical protein
MAHEKLYDADFAEDLMGLGRRQLRKKAYRRQIKLPAIKVGKRLMFDPIDVERIIDGARERFDEDEV